MNAATWTLEALQARVTASLARISLSQANGQVAEVPNARAIRYYQTLGLLSRPVQDGRIALYGQQHLEQLVAIKRLQARGLSLAQVQSHMLSLMPEGIAALASLPMLEENAAAPAGSGAAARKAAASREHSFW